MRVFTVICFSLCPATGESSHCNTPVLCPVPKYFRSFLTESRSFRRTRTVFTHEQLKLMEERFNQDKYLSTHGRNDFARQLKLTPLQVKTWFQNRRMKWKKEIIYVEIHFENVIRDSTVQAQVSFYQYVLFYNITVSQFGREEYSYRKKGGK